MAAFRKEVRAYLEEIVPKDMVYSPDWRDYSKEEHERKNEIIKKLGSKGWLCPTWPTEYGGGGLTAEHAIIIEEEADEFNISLGERGGIAGPSIIVWGTDEQK